MFEARYKKKPPISQLRFIWDFIRGIEDQEICAYIQDSLAKFHPDLVVPGTNSRFKGSYRKVTISPDLTWIDVLRVLREL